MRSGNNITSPEWLAQCAANISVMATNGEQYISPLVSGLG